MVLNVRDIEEAHHFWVDLLGFTQVGEWKGGDGRPDFTMRFYASAGHHHDLALMESENVAEPDEPWSMVGSGCAVNHIAITYPDRDSWKRQVDFLVSEGVTVNRRIDHGMTHSVYVNDPNGYGVEVLYDLPREVWEHDIDGALNYAKNLPTDGPGLTDETEYTSDFWN